MTKKSPENFGWKFLFKMPWMESNFAVYMTKRRSSKNFGWRMGKFRVENGNISGGETFGGGMSKKVIGNLANREMLFHKKALSIIIVKRK